MKFLPEVVRGLDAVDYEATPHALFLTNPSETRPLLDFFLQSQYIKLYQDLKENFGHLSNSVQFNQQMAALEEGTVGVIQSSKIAKIKKAEDLLDEQYQPPASLTGSLSSTSNICSGVCVIKPNQPVNVILRTLKSIANLNPEGLAHTVPDFVQISRIESVPSYSAAQLDLLFEHDIGFDSVPSDDAKLQYREQHEVLFADQPVLQFAVHGQNALGKLKALIGPACQGRGGLDRHQVGDKGQLRSFYGVDRVDNAFFVSESVDEAVIEEDALFTDLEDEQEGSGADAEPVRQVVSKKAQEPGSATANSANSRAPTGRLLLPNKVELALIVISPALVKNNDFVYVLDDFHRAKFGLCALKKRPLSREDLGALFGDLVPKVHNLAVLEAEFLRGDSVLMVLERAQAIESAQSLIGRFGIRVASDYELKKLSKKAAAQQHVSRIGLGGSAADDCPLMREYGSYIFCFPNAALNQRKIAREFTSLPFSKHFKIADLS